MSSRHVHSSSGTESSPVANPRVRGESTSRHDSRSRHKGGSGSKHRHRKRKESADSVFAKIIHDEDFDEDEVGSGRTAEGRSDLRREGGGSKHNSPGRHEGRRESKHGKTELLEARISHLDHEVEVLTASLVGCERMQIALEKSPEIVLDEVAQKVKLVAAEAAKIKEELLNKVSEKEEAQHKLDRRKARADRTRVGSRVGSRKTSSSGTSPRTSSAGSNVTPSSTTSVPRRASSGRSSSAPSSSSKLPGAQRPTREDGKSRSGRKVDTLALPVSASATIEELATPPSTPPARRRKASLPDDLDSYRDAVISKVSVDAALLHALSSALEDATTGTQATTAGLLATFQLIGEIGRGGYGVIYQAKLRRSATSAPPVPVDNFPVRLHLHEDEEVALKVLPFAASQLSATDGVANGTSSAASTPIDLAREVAILTAFLGTPNVVQLRGIFHKASSDLLSSTSSASDDESGPLSPVSQLGAPSLWLAIDLYDAGSFGDMLRVTKSPLLLPEVASLATQLGRGLGALHAANVIHRDVKAANILLDSATGTVYLADFGEAAVLINGLADGLRGTPYFMAPEVAIGEFYSTAADMWSLSMTMVEVTLTKPPNAGLHPLGLLYLLAEIAEGEAPPPTFTQTLAAMEREAGRSSSSLGVDEALVDASAAADRIGRKGIGRALDKVIGRVTDAQARGEVAPPSVVASLVALVGRACSVADPLKRPTLVGPGSEWHSSLAGTQIASAGQEALARRGRSWLTQRRVLKSAASLAASSAPSSTSSLTSSSPRSLMSSTFATEEEEEAEAEAREESGGVRGGNASLARAGSDRASRASSSGASGRARDDEVPPSLTTVRFGNKVVDPASGESLAQFLAGLAAWRRDIAPALAKALASAATSSSTSGVTSTPTPDAGPAGDASAPEEPGRIGTKHMSAERKRAFAEGAALLQIATRLSSPAFGLISTRHTLPESQGGQVVSAFSGADCVDWLYENVRLPTRLEATAIATRLLASDLLVRLTFASSGDASEFDSRFALFRLNKERLRGWSTTYARWSPAGSSDSAPAPSSTVTSSRRWLPFLWSTPASAVNSPDLASDKEAETRSLAKSKEKEEVAEAIPAWFFSAQVTHRDWALLLAGGRVVEFPPDTVILHQQQLNDNLYRVQSGTVRVHKDDKFLVELGDCAMFGEMSVLSLDAKTTACVSAGKDGAVVTVVDIGFVHRLFTREPALARRFYHHICLTLTRIIQQLDGKQTAVPLQAMPSSEYDEALSRDAKFQRAFRLTESQVILMDTPAMLRRLVREYGRLIVAPEYLCFEAKVFGKRTHMAVNVETIAGLKIVSRDTIEVRTTEYRRPLLFHELVDPTSVCDLLDRLRKRRGGSATAPLAAPERVTSRRYPEASDASSLRSKVSSRSVMAGSSAAASSLSNSSDQVQQEETGDLLSADDWSLLLVGAELRRFREGAAVLRQGVAEYTVFQIATGRLAVLIDGKCVGHMGPGETFGEISFLSQSVCSATVQVASAECTLYAMRGDSLAVLFVRKPALGGRFFQYLASILAARLKGREGKSGEADD